MDDNNINNDPIDNGEKKEETIEATSYSVDGKTYDGNTNSYGTKNEPNTNQGSGRTGFTTASLVLGILSVIPCCYNRVGLLFGVLAIVFSVIGKGKAGEQGKKDATAGLVCGIVGVIFSLLVIIVAHIIIVPLITALFQFVTEIIKSITSGEALQGFDIQSFLQSIY